MTRPPVMQRRIRRSAWFVLLALAVEALSLLWKSPLSFFMFLGVSGLLSLVGIGSFLLSLVSPEAEKQI